MIFDVLSQKYKCGCGRGLSIYKSPGILEKINTLAEWDFIHFPRTIEKEVPTGRGDETIKVMLENRAFLGDRPELKPGNCILLRGHVIAIDSPDSIVLAVSESGKDIERIYYEYIEPEWRLLYESVPGVGFSYDEEVDLDQYDSDMPIPYTDYKVWKSIYLNGEERNIHITIEDMLRCEFVLGKWGVHYKESDYGEDDLDYLRDQVYSIMAWFCTYYPRVGDDPEKYNEELIQKAIEEHLNSQEDKED